MSQDDEDKEIRLRDQFATAAMQALITKYGGWADYIEGKSENPTPATSKATRTKRMVAVAYRIADEMRKARLQSFT